MDIKFLKHATLVQELRENIETLNSKLIEYMELASQNVSEKQIEDDLALMEKSMAVEDPLGRLPRLATEELLRMLLLQANSVEGMIMQLDTQTNTSLGEFGL